MTDEAPRARPGGATERVRQELGRVPIDGGTSGRAELAALLRFAGSLHLTGQPDGTRRLTLDVTTTSGAVARRVFQLLQARHGARPELRVRAPGGVRRRTTYGVHIVESARPVAVDAGLIDGEGRPLRRVLDELLGSPRARAAFARGAFLAAGSVSAPGRDPHLEIAVEHEEVASTLADVLEQLSGGHVGRAGGRPFRVVVKSGETIGALLAAMGATGAFLEWDEQRLRRSLRNQANRLANADAANLRRTIDAATEQTRTVERAVARVGWDGLPEELRSVALVRLANPTASLAELGALCDPPMGKSAVHRRLQRLSALATGEVLDD